MLFLTDKSRPAMFPLNTMVPRLALLPLKERGTPEMLAQCGFQVNAFGFPQDNILIPFVWNCLHFAGSS